MDPHVTNAPNARTLRPGERMTPDGTIVSTSGSRIAWQSVGRFFLLAGLIFMGISVGVFVSKTGEALFRWAHVEGWEMASWFKPSLVGWFTVILVSLVALAFLRFLSLYLVRLVNFAFKVAQSDTVTVILAITVNGLFAVLAYYIAPYVIGFLARTTDPFYTQPTLVTTGVVFMALFSAVLWVPRIGVYGENQFGQFDQGTYR